MSCFRRFLFALVCSFHVATQLGCAQSQEGITTEELDRLAHAFCIDKGAYPSPLNYKWYPKSICTSVNNVACHGIPDNRPLKDGDIVSVDVSVRKAKNAPPQPPAEVSIGVTELAGA